MKITFISNYLNHHQYPLCRELIKKEQIEFTFIATVPIRKERLELGYKDMNYEPFVIRTYENEEQAKKAEELCSQSDVVIIGSAPEKYAKIRIESNRLLFRYSERIFRRGFIYSLSPRAIRNIWKFHARYKKRNVYLLCASAYTAMDFNRLGAYKGKTYKWGYFPEVKEYQNVDELIKLKRKHTILWVGRFLELKHPEIAIDIAKYLRKEGIDFEINMIGSGELQKMIENNIIENGLQNHVHILGAMQPEEVRKYMEKSEIFIFTSDFREGWGAVLNEAMNSCCAVVASHAIGSVPFLINNGVNGVIYKNGSFKNIYEGVRNLLLDTDLRKTMQKNAYETMTKQWSPKVAAERFITLAENLLENQQDEVFKAGPCSYATRLTNRWLKG